MNVRSPKPSDRCYSVLSVNCRFVFVLEFFISLVCAWLEKATVLFICIHKRVKSIDFALSITFCDKSGLAIFKLFFLLWIHFIFFHFFQSRGILKRLVRIKKTSLFVIFLYMYNRFMQDYRIFIVAFFRKNIIRLTKFWGENFLCNLQENI